MSGSSTSSNDYPNRQDEGNAGDGDVVDLELVAPSTPGKPKPRPRRVHDRDATSPDSQPAPPPQPEPPQSTQPQASQPQPPPPELELAPEEDDKPAEEPAPAYPAADHWTEVGTPADDEAEYWTEVGTPDDDDCPAPVSEALAPQPSTPADAPPADATPPPLPQAPVPVPPQPGAQEPVAPELVTPEALTPEAVDQEPAPLVPGFDPLSAAEPTYDISEVPILEREGDEEEEEDEAEKFMKVAPGWMLSLVGHLVILIVLALAFLPPMQDSEIVVSLDSLAEENFEEDESDRESIEAPESTELAAAASPLIQKAPITMRDLQYVQPLKAPKLVDPIMDELTSQPDLISEMAGIGRGLEGRFNPESRAELVRQRGGTPESERAVALALAWLAERQLEDGSWSYEINGTYEKGRASNSGTLDSARMAATGMALLPFLGAGNTHLHGKYKKTVSDGLYYLTKNIRYSSTGGAMNFDNGRMYSHGICSIALCEAYGMTQDPALEKPAREALKFIEFAQDPVGGGWRYQPRESGDTSVVGWQLMALKSGHMAYLPVDANTIRNSLNFLENVSSDGGARYGYTSPRTGSPATTAIGLLCRMYLGWKKTEPGLKRGIEALTERGPSEQEMYYNYYATMVMAQFEDREWRRWNIKMRDMLVERQATNGEDRGSWYMGPREVGAAQGGRLYHTCMATMILEVYYRHLPIYGEEASSGFALELNPPEEAEKPETDEDAG